MDADQADAPQVLCPGDVQIQGTGPVSGPGAPVHHVLRLESPHRREDAHLFVQGDGSLFRAGADGRPREADPHRPVRRQHRPGLRPGVLRQPHPHRHLRPRGQPPRPLVPPQAAPLREARGRPARLRLLRRHRPGRETRTAATITTPSPWARNWPPTRATCWKAARRTSPGATAWAPPC